ncbi:hypothetical protein TSUD_353430 [Trifolium subterraneum]|uniref:Uncharacterized protein n=1 Tax=Trifolium subterraneum TaxID=3900 RepID=A0A2Z6NXT2_TRISU|nr:hypothetical protein TSUD_353430 [Trifolium subterraneum]
MPIFWNHMMRSSSSPLLQRLKRHVTGGHFLLSRIFTTLEGHRPTIVHKRSLDILHDPWFNKFKETRIENKVFESLK